jgi:hypothetical protein
MVEKALVEYSYDIDEEIIKEDTGFVCKIISNDDDIVKKIGKASKDLEKELKDVDITKLDTADEKIKPLMELFAKNKGKITYSYDIFENGVIRVFETQDDSLVQDLHNASDSFATTEEEKAKAEAIAAEKGSNEESAEIEEWNPEDIAEEKSTEDYKKDTDSENGPEEE